jgi:hypothetical protein
MFCLAGGGRAERLAPAQITTRMQIIERAGVSLDKLCNQVRTLRRQRRPAGGRAPSRPAGTHTMRRPSADRAGQWPIMISINGSAAAPARVTAAKQWAAGSARVLRI